MKSEKDVPASTGLCASRTRNTWGGCRWGWEMPFDDHVTASQTFRDSESNISRNEGLPRRMPVHTTMERVLPAVLQLEPTLIQPQNRPEDRPAWGGPPPAPTASSIGPELPLRCRPTAGPQNDLGLCHVTLTSDALGLQQTSTRRDKAWLTCTKGAKPRRGCFSHTDLAFKQTSPSNKNLLWPDVCV